MNNKIFILKESSNGYTNVDIDSEFLTSRKIFLTGTVDPDSMDSLFKQIMYLHKEGPEKEITMPLDDAYLLVRGKEPMLTKKYDTEKTYDLEKEI